VSAMWGIYNDTLGTELVERGFISIGWDAMSDLATIGGDRAGIKAAVQRVSRR